MTLLKSTWRGGKETQLALEVLLTLSKNLDNFDLFGIDTEQCG